MHFALSQTVYFANEKNRKVFCNNQLVYTAFLFQCTYHSLILRPKILFQILTEARSYIQTYLLYYEQMNFIFEHTANTSALFFKFPFKS